MGRRHTVYVLECGDGSYYTGYTTDLDRRVEEHRDGDGAKYTRGRGPFRVVHRERFGSRGAALRREAAIKSLARREKERLVAGGAVAPD